MSRWKVVAVGVGLLLVAFMLGRFTGPDKPPTFSDVQVSVEDFRALEPVEDDPFFTDLLDKTFVPVQVATAPGAAEEAVGRFCRARDRSPGSTPTPDAKSPADGALEPERVPAEPVDLSVLYTGGRYGPSTLELFAATPRGAGQRYLYEGVRAPFEWGLDEDGQPWVEGSRTWWVKPAIGTGAGAATGAALGCLVAGTRGCIAGAPVGAVLGAILTF